MKNTINKYDYDEVFQRAALRLHVEIEKELNTEFDSFQFEENKTIRQHREQSAGFIKPSTSIKIILKYNGDEREITGSLAEKIYDRYIDLVDEELNPNVCICESLL